MSWMAGHSPQSCFIQFAVDLVLGYARYCKMHSTFERLLSLLWDTLSAFGMWSVLDCMICKDKVRIILPDISVDMAYGFFCRESTKALLCVCAAQPLHFERPWVAWRSGHIMSYPGQEVYEALKVSKMKLAEHISVLSPQHTWRANLFQTWSVDGMFFERGPWCCEYVILAIFRSTAGGDAGAGPFTYTCSFTCCGI